MSVNLKHHIFQTVRLSLGMFECYVNSNTLSCKQFVYSWSCLNDNMKHAIRYVYSSFILGQVWMTISNTLSCNHFVYSRLQNRGVPPRRFPPRRKCEMKLSCFFFCKKLKNFLEKSLETNGEPFISADCFLLSLHSANCFYSSGPNNYASPCWPDFISFPWKYFTLLLTNAETFGSFGTLCRGRPVSQAVRLLSYHRGPSSVPGSYKWGSY